MKPISNKKRVEWMARRAKINSCDGTFIWTIVVPGMGYGLFKNGLDAAIRESEK